jgi:hypothetical protein
MAAIQRGVIIARLGTLIPMSSDGDWPEFTDLKSHNFESRLDDRERQSHEPLLRDEIALRKLQEGAACNYERVCGSINWIRSVKNHSRNKLANFRKPIHDALSFFKMACGLFEPLSRNLLGGAPNGHLLSLFRRNVEAFNSAVGDLQLHVELHVERGQAARIPFQHLVKLRKLLDDVVAAFAGSMAPLSIAFSAKIRPILCERERFFVAQRRGVAERGAKLSELRNEMLQMIERRKRLVAGSISLDRMFDVLMKFKNAMPMEEEDDADFDAPSERFLR